MDNTENKSEYQIMVVNMFYDKEDYKHRSKGKNKEIPDPLVLDVPQDILKVEEKDEKEFMDLVETFAYNTVYRKYGVELYSCQVFLPSDSVTEG